MGHLSSVEIHIPEVNLFLFSKSMLCDLSIEFCEALFT